MLMSPAGKNKLSFLKRLRANEGFTLIEMMVVIVIIGLMTSFVVINLPGGASTVQEDADRVAARFTYAAREAVLSGETIGVQLTRIGYKFMNRRRGSWRDMELIPGDIDIVWPEDLEVSLRLRGERQVLPRTKAAADGQAPFLYFTPTGESVRFELALNKLGRSASISGNTLGEVSSRRERR